MKTLGKYFLQGVLFLAPIFLTVMIISKLLIAWDTTAAAIFPVDIPGLSMIISIAAIIVIGYTGSWWLNSRVLNLVTRGLESTSSPVCLCHC